VVVAVEESREGTAADVREMPITVLAQTAHDAAAEAEEVA
jgi:hypothetical protein